LAASSSALALGERLGESFVTLVWEDGQMVPTVFYLILIMTSASGEVSITNAGSYFSREACDRGAVAVQKQLREEFRLDLSYVCLDSTTGRPKDAD
jgi:hypothetical protein